LKTHQEAIAAFINKTSRKGANWRVEVNSEQTKYPFVMYSYNVVVAFADFNGKIHLLPIPAKDASKEQGGSKTTRAFVKALWERFPAAAKMKG